MKMLNANWNKMTQEKGEQQQQQQEHQSSHVFVRCAWIKWHTCETHKTILRYLYKTFSYRHLRSTRRINDTFIYATTHTHTCISIIWTSFCTSITSSFMPSNWHRNSTNVNFNCALFSICSFCVSVYVWLRTRLTKTVDMVIWDYDKKSHILIDTVSFAF